MEYFSQEDMEEISLVAKEFLFNGPGQVKVNHAGCSAGTDTKKRLYIRITEDGDKILAYCHHCNKRGIKPLNRLTRIPSTEAIESVWDDKTGEGKMHGVTKWQNAASEYHYATPMTLKLAMDPNFRHGFPLVWFNQGHLETMEATGFYGMRFTPSYVLVPRYGESGLLGVDRRLIQAVGGTFDTGPKWIRTLALGADQNEVAGKIIVYNTYQSTIGVLVEDPISAMRLDLLGYGAIALTGSSLGSDDAFKISLLFKKVVVWLDNDNNTIIKNAVSAAMRLNMYNIEKVGLVTGTDDPKRHTDTEIHKLINEALK